MPYDATFDLFVHLFELYVFVLLRFGFCLYLRII